MSHKNSSKSTLKFLLITFLLGGIFIFCSAEMIKAQEEGNGLRILYQGNLSDGQGGPAKDGNYNMRFSIYDAETQGSIIWQEEYIFYNAIFVKNGKFKIILGRLKPLNLEIEQGPFWLDVSLGQLTESGEVVWSLGAEQRKKIVNLSDFLKQEGLGYLEEGGITEKEWEEIYKLLEEKLGQQPNLILLFDLEISESNGNGSGSQLFDVLKAFINFISEKISEVGDMIVELAEKMDDVLAKLEEITSVLFNMGSKIDRLYQVLVVDKGLESGEPLPSVGEVDNYSSQKFERLVIKEGESSIRIFNKSIKAESLIFISFLEDPGSYWWISEKAPGDSFSLFLKEPASRDLIFNYWVLNEEDQSVPSLETESPAGGTEAKEMIETEEIESATATPIIEETEPATSSVQTNEESVQEEIPPIEPEAEGGLPESLPEE